MSATVSSPLGWPVPTMTSLFPAGLRGIPGDTVPRVLAIAGSSSPGLAPSTESFPSFHLRSAFTSRAFLGVPYFSIATSMPRVHTQQASHVLPSFRPQRFSRSRRLTPLGTLRACFIPQPRPRFTPQGFPPAVSPSSFHPSVPSCRFCLSPTGKQASRGQLQTSASRASIPTAGPL